MDLLLYKLFSIVKDLLLCLTLDLIVFVTDATILEWWLHRRTSLAAWAIEVGLGRAANDG
jgi:hypothetical protein